MREADDRDDAEEAVEEEQEERDREEAARCPRSAPRAASPRRAWPRCRCARPARTRPAARRSGGRARGPRASSIESRPGDLACAARDPVREFWLKSIDGNERISPSRTIAKLWLKFALGVDSRAGSPAERPRCASSRVMSWNLSPPVVRELERDDRLAVLVEVLRVPVAVQVLAGQLRDRLLGVGRLVLEEVVVVRVAGNRRRRDRAVAVGPQVRIVRPSGTA